MKTQPAIRFVLFAVLLLAMLTACGVPKRGPAETSQSVPEAATANPPAAEPPASAAIDAGGVTILLINDVHGMVDPCG